VSCVRFPFLSGLPAIFQVFFAVLTSFPQVGHFAIHFTFLPIRYVHHYIKHFPFESSEKAEKRESTPASQEIGS
jgi:hypothetical protein